MLISRTAGKKRPQPGRGEIAVDGTHCQGRLGWTRSGAGKNDGYVSCKNNFVHLRGDRIMWRFARCNHLIISFLLTPCYEHADSEGLSLTWSMACCKVVSSLKWNLIPEGVAKHFIIYFYLQKCLCMINFIIIVMCLLIYIFSYTFQSSIDLYTNLSLLFLC